MKSNEELTSLLADMEAAIIAEAADNGIEETTWAEAVGEMGRQLREAREEAEVQDNCNQAIYATVERAIGSGDWHSQMEAVEDLAGRYAAAREDSVRLSEVYRRADVDPRGYIAFRPIQLPAKADWDGVTCRWDRDIFNAAIDAARDGK